jgi:hypothetical protein
VHPDDITKLLADFSELELAGGVLLVEKLSAPANDDVLRIGSITLGLPKIDRSKFTTVEELARAVLSLPSVHFGQADGTIAPLQSLASFVQGIKVVSPPPVTLKSVDLLLNDLAIVLETGSIVGCQFISSATVLRASGMTMVQ